MNRTHLSFGVVLVLGALALAPAPAAAADRPDFSGTFKLDLKASDSLDEMLKAQGASWVERKAAGSVVVTQVVRHRGDVLEIEAKSSVKSRKQTIRIGAGWEEQETEMGKGRARTDWDADGKTLVTRVEVKSKKGESGEMTMRRSLADEGQTTVQALELRGKDGKTYKARRILRRVPDKK
jgi:hypothetical protein